MSQNTPKHASPLLTLDEAARYLRISQRTLRAMRQRGEVPTVNVVRGRPRIPKAALDDLIKRKTQQPLPKTHRRRRRS